MKIVILSMFLLLPVQVRALEVQGHRGCRWGRPENTIAAFREALRLGVDVLEFDLNVTKDDVAVVTHDSSLSPNLCLGPGGKPLEKPIPIRSLAFSELQEYDCGTLPNAHFPDQVPSPGEKIPSLEEVFHFVKTERPDLAATIRFNIETKMDGKHPENSPSPAEFARLIAPIINGSGFADRITIQSFDWRTLPEMEKVSPGIKLSLLVALDGVSALFNPPCRVDIISPNYRLVSPALVARLHKKNIKVLPWTVNTEKAWDRMVKLGVDGIITDNPGGLISYLKAKGLRDAEE